MSVKYYWPSSSVSLPYYTMLLISTIFVYFITPLCVLLLCALYFYQKYMYSYWKNMGVPYIEPSWIFGSVKNEVLHKESWTAFVLRCYEQFKDHGFGGVFIMNLPALVVCSPDFIEEILIRDFESFHDRWDDRFDDPLGKSLFHGTGNMWRNMRVQLRPAFSSNKVRSMFEQISMSCENVMELMTETLREDNSSDVQPLAFTFATEVIAGCAFGLQFGSDTEESKKFRHILNSLFTKKPLELFLYSLKLRLHPTLIKWFKIKLFFKEVESYFESLCKSAMEYRIKNEFKRQDFLSFMMDLKEKEEQSQKLPTSKLLPYPPAEISKETVFCESSIASMMFNFFFAGVKPTESTLSFALFEIAKNQEIQSKICEEVKSNIDLHKGWTYEALRDMTYLDQVIQETLRMYTYNPIIFRLVTRPYQIPNTDIVLPKRLSVIIPLVAIHMDPQYHPSPEIFNPERFEGNNFKPSPSFMPFGDGPRICVSVKLAVTAMKLFLAKVLNKYTLRIDEKRMKLPLRYDPNEWFPKPVEGIVLLFQEKKD